MILSAILTLIIITYFSIIGSKYEIRDWLFLIFILFFSIDELRRAILILNNKIEYVFVARLGFFIFGIFLPRKTYDAYLEHYHKNTMKFSAICTVIGVPILILISISELIK